MALLNRILATLMMLVILIGALLALAMVLFWPAETLTWADAWILYFLAGNLGEFQQWGLIVALVAGVVSLVFLLVETAPRASGMVRLSQVTSGQGMVSQRTVEERLRRDLAAADEVIEVKPSVKAKGKGMELTLDVRLAANANLTAKTEELSQMARTILEGDLGILLQNLTVKVRQDTGPAKAKTPAS